MAAVPRRTSTGATCDGLVVAEAFSWVGGRGEIAAEAEGEVVAVALGGGAGVEAAEDDVRYTLALRMKSAWASGLVIDELCDHTVNTFPPTTAALPDGERNEFLGIRTSTGLRQPWLSGMSSDIRDRKQYIMAE